MSNEPTEIARDWARLLVAELGGHPAGKLGIDVGAGDESGLGRWLLASMLLSSRVGEARALAAYRALERAGLADPGRIAEGGHGRDAALGAVLGAEDFPDPERSAARLGRASRALAERWGGSLDALASEAGDLEELGTRLASLAPGLGPGTVARFLRALRDRWPAADELPLTAAAHAAARHLDLVAEHCDAEAAPAVLRSLLAGTADAPALADLEAALSRLGALACRREGSRRCPLGARCPQRRAE